MNSSIFLRANILLIVSFWDGLSTFISLELLLNLLLDLDIIETSLLFLWIFWIILWSWPQIELIDWSFNKSYMMYQGKLSELTNINKIFIILDFRNQYSVQFFQYFLCKIYKFFVCNFLFVCGSSAFHKLL